MAEALFSLSTIVTRSRVSRQQIRSVWIMDEYQRCVAELGHDALIEQLTGLLIRQMYKVCRSSGSRTSDWSGKQTLESLEAALARASAESGRITGGQRVSASLGLLHNQQPARVVVLGRTVGTITAKGGETCAKRHRSENGS